MNWVWGVVCIEAPPANLSLIGSGIRLALTHGTFQGLLAAAIERVERRTKFEKDKEI